MDSVKYDKLISDLKRVENDIQRLCSEKSEAYENRVHGSLKYGDSNTNILAARAQLMKSMLYKMENFIDHITFFNEEIEAFLKNEPFYENLGFYKKNKIIFHVKK